MKIYNKICKTCGREFVTESKNQQYCCFECRPRTHKKYSRYKRKQSKISTLTDVAKESKANGISYGQYVAMQYLKERMNKNNE